MEGHGVGAMGLTFYSRIPFEGTLAKVGTWSQTFKAKSSQLRHSLSKKVP